MKKKQLLYPLLFLLSGYLLTAFYLRDYLQQTAELTPFFTIGEFFCDCMLKPGGGLTYLASFLSSFFYSPWIGVTLLLGLLTALAYALKRSFLLSIQWEGLCFVPSFLLLLNYTQLGYLIYILKSPGHAFVAPIGLLFCVLLVGAYKRMRQPAGRYSFILAIAIGGYPLMGGYALLSLLLILLDEIAQEFSIHHAGAVVRTLLCLLTGVVTPYLYYLFVYSRMRLETIYLATFPDYAFNATEGTLWLPLLFSIVCICGLSLITYFRTKKYHLFVAVVSFVLAGGATFLYTNREANFHSLLQMNNAVENGHWEKVLTIARKNKTAPTRLQVLYSNLALQQLGRAGNEMFTYPNGDAPYPCARPHQYLRLMGARALYYYYGNINYCYRWCMEDLVEYGVRPTYLKYMVKCSLLNHEPLLAAKYIDALEHTLFYKSWSSHYKEYLTHPERIEQDEEMAKILRLRGYENQLDGDGGLIEQYLLHNFALMEGGSKELVELSLQCNLILKDIQGFWPRFFALLPTFNGTIPVHYQEAALLFSALKGDVDVSQLPIDSTIKERFQALIKASTENGKRGNEYNRRALAPQYSTTYWYYYFFITGLKTN